MCQKVKMQEKGGEDTECFFILINNQYVICISDTVWFLIVYWL
ncbi:hypothetical protein XIS1_1650006 [Xenorhabdus innexi]|uniref:Uncharacterized protein n=1 Tax=Xenorhabdus innexi TaxID=290109 RepID=A0A1N6MVG5_9GAMM|nr:hypothetical protein XIS1_1650006 [Xenorhabdus innexi]